MWPNLQETAELIPFAEEILNGKLHFCPVKVDWSEQYVKKKTVGSNCQKTYIFCHLLTQESKSNKVFTHCEVPEINLGLQFIYQTKVVFNRFLKF